MLELLRSTLQPYPPSIYIYIHAYQLTLFLRYELRTCRQNRLVAVLHRQWFGSTPPWTFSCVDVRDVIVSLDCEDSPTPCTHIRLQHDSAALLNQQLPLQEALSCSPASIVLIAFCILSLSHFHLFC